MAARGPFASLLRDHARARQILQLLKDSSQAGAAVRVPIGAQKISPAGLGVDTLYEEEAKYVPGEHIGEKKHMGLATKLMSVESDPSKTIANYPRSPYHRKLMWSNLLIKELSIHAAIEEEALYPLLRTIGGQGKDWADRSIKEHLTVKRLLNSLDGMSPRDVNFDPTVSTIGDNLMEHIKEEENELFPFMEKNLKLETLQRLEKTLARLRPLAPTRPHPMAPSRPPANYIVGSLSAIVDRVRDLGKTFPPIK